MPKLHVGHPIADLDTWSQAVISVRSDGPSRGEHVEKIATFLFTDIEGSTRRWQVDASAMRIALETHDLVLRGAVEVNGGEVFACTGDGMCAVFASPKDAVDAAVAAQRVLELPVRMAVCTGEAERRGGNYFGTVLNRTARVMAAGHGGQVLLDGATAELLDRADLIFLGRRRLRDINSPVSVYQLRASGLRTEFPALRTVDPTPGNIEPAQTRLIGRSTELAVLPTVLDTHRLITLTGMGGVGKTRLATEVAIRLSNDFADGAFLIDLAEAGDSSTVLDAAATALEIHCETGTERIDSIIAALQGKTRLLVFDNCEHVLDATAELMAAILARTAHIKMLATSREATMLPGERIWPVNPLYIASATELFVDRAAAVGVSIADAESTDVVEICRRIDCLPLAIVLAASRLTSLTVNDLRSRFDDRILVGSRRVVERHRTLRNAVQWSYDLLSAAERAMFARCSAFDGEFGFSAANAVSGLPDEFTTLDMLDALVRS